MIKRSWAYVDSAPVARPSKSLPARRLLGAVMAAAGVAFSIGACGSGAADGADHDSDHSDDRTGESMAGENPVATGEADDDSMPEPTAAEVDSDPPRILDAPDPSLDEDKEPDLPKSLDTSLDDKGTEIDDTATLLEADGDDAASPVPAKSANGVVTAADIWTGPRCADLDNCADGDEILCPPGTPLEGSPAWTCFFQEEFDPDTGGECTAFTWYYLGDCSGNDDDNDRYTATNKRPQYFYKGSSGGVYWKQRIGGKWTKASKIGGGARLGPSVKTNRKGVMTVVVTGSNKAVYEKHRVTGGWSSWKNLGGRITNGATLAKGPDGRLAVFGRSGNGAIYYKYQTKTNGSKSPWSGWRNLGGSVDDSHVQVMLNTNGSFEIFTRSYAGNFYHKRGTIGGRWGGWHNLGSVWGGAPFRAERLRYGYLKVVNAQNDDFRYIRYETQHSGTTWADWSYCPL